MKKRNNAHNKFSWKHGNLGEFASKSSSIKSFDDFNSRGNFVETWWKLAESFVLSVRVVILSFFIFVSVFCEAQVNLVPNFSFEIYDTCPNTEDQAEYALGWSKYSSNSPYVSTPDYYNTCSADTLMGVPKSFSCFQQDHRNCGAYMGLGTYCTCYSNAREHIGIQLSTPLVIGQKYFLSFYTVLGEYWLGTNLSGMPSNNIGLRLSTVSYNPTNAVPIDNFAHLRSVSVITDSINWTRVSGSIIADSAYNYLIIGNFFDDLNTDTVQYSCGSCLNYASFYLVDDICVSTDSILANGGIDVLPCTVSIPEIYISEDINVYPNPVTSVLSCSFSQSLNGNIMLYSGLGDMILSREVKNSNLFELDLTGLPSGCYFLKINSISDKRFYTKKIIKP